GVAAHGDRLYLYSSCLGGLPGGPGTSLYQIDLAGGGVSEVADRVLPWELPVTTSFFLPPSDPPVLAPPAVVGDEVYFVRRPNADEELWRLRDGAVEPVAAPLPTEIDKVVAAGEAPVVVTGTGLAHVVVDGELESLGLFVVHPALDLYAEAADGDLFLGASDGSIWRTDGTPEGTSPVSRPTGGAIGFTGFVRAGDRLYFAHDDGEHDVELWATVVEEETTFGCVEDGATLCLADGRFAVTVAWRDPRSGGEGVGHAVPETADSGFFWFFHPDNLEVLTKVLDAETVNGHHWVFHGSLTDVRYELRVEDLATGDVRSYERPAGSLCGGADTAAFPTGVEAAGGGAVASGPATPASASLLLGADDRFTVAVDWLDPATGSYVPATTVEETADSGWAWFFDPANVEVFVKVLDATPVDGRHWVFHGGLTDLGYRVTVIDGLSGAQRVYEKAPGSLCGDADTAAF
ncbi:MAG TPA: hypothetical protein VHM02_01265, partial [Thermoanaerobaculia bacterium]|nr:hypothetical protein [Thermoanaerobaculia bacterium]